MSNSYDLKCAIEALAYTAGNFSGTTLDDVDTALSNLVSEVANVEDEFSYVEDDLAELEDWKECGFDQPCDASRAYDIIDEFGGFEEAEEAVAAVKGDADLRAEFEQLNTEHENLKKFHENQRQIIKALLAHFRCVSELINEDSITSVMVGAARGE